MLLPTTPGMAAWPAALIVWGPGFASTAHRHHCVQLLMTLRGSLLVRSGHGGRVEETRECACSPGWVFFSHPRDELSDLLDHAGTSEPLAGIGPFPGDEVSVPPQNCVRRHDRRDLAQCRASKTVSTYREATPLITRESQPAAPQLGTQDAILFHQIPDHVLLTSAEPAREGREEDLKRGTGNNHGASLLHCRGSHGRRSGRVLGHYALESYVAHWKEDWCGLDRVAEDGVRPRPRGLSFRKAAVAAVDRKVTLQRGRRYQRELCAACRSAGGRLMMSEWVATCALTTCSALVIASVSPTR